MRVTDDPAAASELIRQIHENMGGEERLPGIHVSDLIYCLRKSWARQLGVPMPPSEVAILMFMNGRALHGRMELVEGETLVEVDGVHGSIDRVERDLGRPAIPTEIKTTYASAAVTVEDLAKKSAGYFDQLGSYAYMLGVLQGRLYILNLNGIYGYMRKKGLDEWLEELLTSYGYDRDDRPMLRAVTVDFNQEELDLHWERLMGRKRMIEEALERSRARGSIDLRDAPPLPEHWTYECEHCPLKESLRCPGGDGRWKGSFKLETTEEFDFG